MLFIPVVVGFGTFFFVPVVTTNSEQSSARHTKVMDSYPGPMKKDRAQKIIILGLVIMN